MVPRTVIPAHLSYFIPNMPFRSLMLYPPVSKVMAFPSRTIGAESGSVVGPTYSITIICAGVLLPRPTERSALAPSASSSFWPRTVQVKPSCAECSDIPLARESGFTRLGGWFDHSRARFTPAVMAPIRSTWCLKSSSSRSASKTISMALPEPRSDLC